MNDQNLIPNSARSPIELREQTKRGGIASGKSRKEKASLRKAAQDVLNGTYKDKTGQEFDGAKVVILNLFKIANDIHNKQCIQAIRLLMELYGEEKSPEEKEKVNAEIELLKAKAKAVKGFSEMDVEDLSALADMLMGKENEKNKND